MTKKGSVRSVVTTVITIALFAFLASCGGGGDSGTTAGATGTITLVVSATSIPADGSSSSTITATVTDSAGNPVRHYTNVTFSTNLGHFMGNVKSITIQTQPPLKDGKPDLDAAPTGVASVALIAGTTPGSAKVTVSSNGVSQSVYVTISGPAASVTLSAFPVSIPADGTSSSTITATLTNSSGTPVTPGTEVTFTTTLGTFAVSAQKGEALGTLSNGSQTYTVKTPDASGIVRVSLVAGTTAGSALVTATSNNVTQAIYVGFGGNPVSIVLTANPASIWADGKSSSAVQATLTDGTGAAVIPGTTVTFTTDLGSFSNGSRTYTVTTPDSTGMVTVSLIAGTTTGSALVSATANSVTQSIYVAFTEKGGEPFAIALLADPASITADGSTSSKITATLTDSVGSPVNPGTWVTFSTTLGSFSNGAKTYTVTTPDATGVVSVSLIAGTTAGSALVTATASGVTQSVTVTFTGAVVASITVTATPSTLTADGASKSDVRADVNDAQGNPVADGEKITFTIISGTGTLSATSATTSGGYAIVTYTASKTPGSVVIQAMSANNVSGTVTITLESGGVGSITLVALPTSISADGTSSSTITATLTDASGKPVAKGTTVTFTTTLGTLSSSSAATPDDTGIVVVSLIAGTDPGTATVTASSGGVSQSVTVTITGGVPDVGSIGVSANPTSIPADGASTSTITALVKTADNQVVKGASVTFTATRGSITSPHTTDDNGKATATLTSERYVDASVTVTAKCQGKEAITIVAFTGLTLTLTADPQSLLTGGSSTITATLKDAASNPIPNTTVTFSTDKGTLTPPTPQTTDSSGQASVTLTSNDSGIATVTGTALGATGTVQVNFTRYSFTLAANPTTIRVGGETSQITAQLLETGVPKAGETVYFSTTLGTLNPYQQNTGADGKAASTLTSGNQSGVAVIDASATIATDTPPTELAANTQVVVTGGTADKIVLTASPDVIDVNTGVSTITANVYDANDQPAGNQNVYFRINTGPGGGEYLSTSVKTTNTYGVATISFYAGSLTSTLKGVQIEANTQSDFSGSYGLATLTIAGPVANIGIGMNLETLEPSGGSLKIDISGIATDVNGNPVADGTKIYFAVTAVEFDEDRANDGTIDCWDDNKNPLIPCPPIGTPGFGLTWFSDDVNQDGTMYSLGGPMCTTEDVNHNGILDPGEDKNDNGVIDPIQGCTIDASVETTSGVANATLIYPAPQANNIRVQITAEAGGVSNFYQTILLCTTLMVENGTCGIAYYAAGRSRRYWILASGFWISRVKLETGNLKLGTELLVFRSVSALCL